MQITPVNGQIWEEKWSTLFEAQDEVDRQHEGLIAVIEGKSQQSISATNLLAIR